MNDEIYGELDIEMCCENCFSKDENNPIHLVKKNYFMWECPNCKNRISINIEKKRDN